MHHHAVLHVGTCAQCDGLVVTSQNGTKPDIDIFSGDHISDDRCLLSHKACFIQLRSAVAESIRCQCMADTEKTLASILDSIFAVELQLQKYQSSLTLAGDSSLLLLARTCWAQISHASKYLRHMASELLYLAKQCCNAHACFLQTRSSTEMTRLGFLEPNNILLLPFRLR